MGAWGVGIFSDDTAADVRDEYVDLLGDGLSGPEATQRLLEDWRDSLDDIDEAPVVWLALAATQWKYGRLQEDVKAKALKIIDKGTGLHLWEAQGQSLLKKRKAALEKLRDQLQSPQPATKKVPKRYKTTSDLELGDAISYRLRSGRCVIFRVTFVFRERSGNSPVYELCDWVGDEIPSAQRIESLPQKRRPDTGQVENTFIAWRGKDDYPADRVQVVAHGLSNRHCAALASTSWAKLDEYLEKRHGLS